MSERGNTHASTPRSKRKSANHAAPLRETSTRTCGGTARSPIAANAGALPANASHRSRPRADLMRSAVDEDRGGLFQQVLECLDHRGGVVAVDEAVIEGRGEIHHEAHRDLPVDHDGALDG